MIFLREALTTLLCEEGSATLFFFFSFERLDFSCISEHPPGRRPGGILTRCLTGLHWLLSEQRSSGSTWSLSQMYVLLTLISKAQASPPAKSAYFSRLYFQPCSFSHYPQFLIIGEGWDRDGSLNRELHLVARFSPHHNGPVQPDPLGHLTLHCSLICEQVPSFVNKILKLLQLGQLLLPKLQEQK